MRLSEKGIRLRERIMTEKSFEAFDESETLQLILTYANIKRDPEEVAERLLETFGSLKGVLEARPEQLMNVEGVGAMAVSLISMIVPMTRIYERACSREQKMIRNTNEACDFVKTLLLGERSEKIYVICLNVQCKILGYRLLSEGDLSEVEIRPRKIVDIAINQNANSVLIAHNHPGGTLAPSYDDLKATKQIKKILNSLGITLLDHIIVAGCGTYSMIQHGDIDYGKEAV